MNIIEQYHYNHERIKNKLYSQREYHRNEIRKLWPNRHIGQNGIDADMVKALIVGEIREARVWAWMNYYINTNNKLNK